MKTPITYWGGKQKLVSTILPLIPEHITYCEPFFGGGAVFFAKPKSKVEIINDLNQFVVNFYRQAKSNFPALEQKINETPHSRRMWRDALVMYEHPHLFEDIDRAWAFWTLCNQGYSGQIGTWGFGTTSCCSERKVKNSRDAFSSGELVERLDLTQIECNDALYLIKIRDRESTFFYLDPPYFNSHMAHYGGYTESDFESLLQACANIKGKFIMSSFPSEILSKYTQQFGWHQVKIDAITCASIKRKPKVEVLTANYPI
jgi:DNA adenine methylase